MIKKFWSVDTAASVFWGSRWIMNVLNIISTWPILKIGVSRQQVFTLSRWLLAVLLFSCIFIPRFTLGEIASFYRFDIRSEDLLLGIITILTLGLMARTTSSDVLMPELPAVEKSFLVFLVACQISIFSGIFFRTVDKPLVSLFYLIKWFEYFLVFAVTARLTAGIKERSFFLWVFFVLGLAVSFYGYLEYFFPASKAVYPNYYRLFERPPFHGDANHIGGFLSLWMAFFIGMFLSTEKETQKRFFFFAVLFAFFPFIWTYSRKSYFALAGVLLLAVLLTQNRRRIIVLICVLTLLGLFLPTRLSERLMDLNVTFATTDPFRSSWAGGIHVWQDSFWNFNRFWLTGSGLASRHRLFYESQYVLILAETGILGAAAFLRLCLNMIREAVSRFKYVASNDEKGILLGWVLGFFALMIHSFSCVSLTVSKIAIPFWFLTAFVFAGIQPQLKKVSDS